MKPALVTGCAGFIGSVLTRRLLARGGDVVGFDNYSRGSADAIGDLLRHPRFTFVEGDVRSPDDVARAFARAPQAVFHLAARHFIPECAADPVGTYEINVIGTERVWEAARAAGVDRVFFMSTGDVYKPSSSAHAESDPIGPFNVYGVSKLVSELSLGVAREGHRPRLTIVRMFNVYGPGDRNEHLIPAILAQARAGMCELRLGNLWPVRDYIYVDDAADALIRLLDAAAPPDVVNVGTGGGWTVEQVVRELGVAFGFPLRAISVRELQRPVERDTLRPNIDRLAAVTSWRPGRTLSDGLREFAAARQS